MKEKQETVTWTQEEIEKNLSDDEQVALIHLLRKAKNGKPEVPPEVGATADLSINEQLVERLKALLRDPSIPDDVKSKIRTLLGSQNEALKEVLDQHSKTQTQPTKKSWMDPLNIDAASLMEKNIEELQREAGWTRVNPHITDPDERAYHTIESMRRSSAEMDRLCQNMLAGQMPNEDVIRKLSFRDIGMLERWHKHSRYLALKDEPIQKRGIVHQEEPKQYTDPMDFTASELMTMDIRQLMKKAGWEPVDNR